VIQLGEPAPAASGSGIRSVLVSLGVLAAVVHLAMVPSHWGEWRVEGVLFAVTGWVQLALAAACWARPSRRVLLATAFVNLGAVAAWAVTRTSGSPWGPHAWHAESVTLVDGAVVAAEVALFVLCGVALALRGPLPSALRGVRVAFAAPIAATLLATAVLASPSARNHAHDAHGGHDDHADVAATADHDHADIATVHDVDDDHDDASAAHDHAAVEPVADDRGLSLLENGHQHGAGEVELDLQTRIRLDAQLAVTLDLAAKYPTVADAEAAGFRRAGPFSPGLGTHYLPPNFAPNADGYMDPEDLQWPTLIFDGWAPDSPIAGFMYQAYGSGDQAPEGFAGPNDHWHYHTDVCVVFRPDGVDAPLGADHSATKAQCDEYGGVLIPRTGYMVHVWTVPGYESDRGIFSEVNPAIACPDGSYHMRPADEYGLSPTTCLV
jgi:hypothetical protein